MFHSESNTEIGFAKSANVGSLLAPVGAMVSGITLICGFIMFNTFDVAWMTPFWKFSLTLVVSFIAGWVVSLLGQRWLNKLNARKQAEARAEQNLVKERELVKFIATKAWPPK